MSKRKIGIVGYSNGNMFGVGNDYIDFIVYRLTGEPVVLSPSSPIHDDLNLLILPGGPDINPLRYNSIPRFETGKPDPIREFFDVRHLPAYIENKTPIFGICRGLQSLAVHFGAILWQHMTHETNPDHDPYKHVHGINILSHANKKINVNSRHHQSVVRESLKDTDIAILATHSKWSADVEAIAVNGLPIRAVQYHPEDLSELSGVEYAVSLVKEIIK